VRPAPATPNNDPMIATPAAEPRTVAPAPPIITPAPAAISGAAKPPVKPTVKQLHYQRSNTSEKKRTSRRNEKQGHISFTTHL